ncbi:MAG: oligosaccharide flippase family protein [Paludibacter sp.]|nr:oligosaccharide flippase family protein [Paludibacter sp.]
MIVDIYKKLKVLIIQGDTRTIKAKKNIFGSFIIKVLSIIISFLLVPLTLDFLNPYEYGIWLTLSSIIIWIDFLDIGLGNGLRNKLSEALAKDDMKLAQIYVSTTFYLLIAVVFIFFLLFISFNYIINWYEILNVDQAIIPDLKNIILFVFVFVLFSFVLKIVNNIYLAFQMPVLTSILSFSGQLLTLVFIYLAGYLVDKGDLWYVSIIYIISPTIVLLIAFPLTFFVKYKAIRPKATLIRIQYLKDLLGVGIQFFFIQVGGLLIFTTSNLIISNVLGPSDVTTYNIVYKYFYTIVFLYLIIITPMWSASTEAYIKRDLKWIISSVKTMLKIAALLVGIIVLMILFSGFVYNIWIGDKVSIPFSLSIISGVYMIILIFSTCFSTFIFGIGKLRLQLLNTLISGLIFIPFAYFMSEKFGVTGVIIALCIVNIPALILNPIQFYKIIKGKAKGIWNR